jgi:hypothetical protein
VEDRNSWEVSRQDGSTGLQVSVTIKTVFCSDFSMGRVPLSEAE